ncbi:hypothetical protein PG989_007515 [Apiospora arundinis]
MEWLIFRSPFSPRTGKVSLFWPGAARAATEPFWQSLEQLQVILDVRRPLGGCYFWGCRRDPLFDYDLTKAHEVPPGYEKSNDDYAASVAGFVPITHDINRVVREEVIPTDEHVAPLMEAFGRACLQMPNLRSAELSVLMCAPRGGGRGGLSLRCTWGVWYFSPGTPHYAARTSDPVCSENVQERRLFWDVKEWRPPATLQDTFREIGREQHGGHLVERFVDSWGTVRRDQITQERIRVGERSGAPM